MIRRAAGVLVLMVAIMLQASTQICLGRQILSTGSGRPSDDEMSTTQEVNYIELSFVGTAVPRPWDSANLWTNFAMT
jgi:hypothetical protein